MKHFIFRKNYLGFYDWAHAMNKIRRLIHGYDIIGEPAFAKDIHIENIDPVFRWSDMATGIRVVFISKGPGYDKT